MGTPRLGFQGNVFVTSGINSPVLRGQRGLVDTRGTPAPDRILRQKTDRVVVPVVTRSGNVLSCLLTVHYY